MNFMNNYLKPAIERGSIEMTIPDKTKKGMLLKQSQYRGLLT